MKEIICLNCHQKVWKKEHRQRFCSMKCAGEYSNKHRVLSENSKIRILEGAKKWRKQNPEANFRNGIKGTKGKYYGNITSILDVSKRTAHKILKRLNLGCCVCGWNEAPCDIHHINGKKVKDANNHDNLTLLCPNHHRMYHNKKIQKSDVKTLTEYFPSNWNENYYG